MDPYKFYLPSSGKTNEREDMKYSNTFMSTDDLFANINSI